MTKIWITGDIHGNAASFKQRIEHYILNATEQDILICAGDVGLEYGNQIQGSLKKAMKKFPGSVIVMRGNHDNRYWDRHIFNNPDTQNWRYVDDKSYPPQFIYQKKYPNIWYVRDEGGIVSIGGYMFLFLPGAYSIDKYYRLQNNLPYTFDEQLNYVEMTDLIDKLQNWFYYGGHIDFVISHTFPLSWEPCYKDLFLNFIDQSQVDKNTEKFLDNIEKILDNNYIHWFGGHFHDDRELNEKVTMLYSKIVEIGDYIER